MGSWVLQAGIRNPGVALICLLLEPNKAKDL